jgi:hypothetical protein
MEMFITFHTEFSHKTQIDALNISIFTWSNVVIEGDNPP